MQYYRVERNTSRVNREFRLKRTENMIYSPQQGIPLGEAVILPNGTHGSEKTAKSQK